MASSLWEQRWQLWRWYWLWYWMQWAVLFCELTLFGVPISVYRVVAIHNTVRNSFWRGRTNVWVIFQKDLEKAPKRCWQYLVVKNLPKIYGLKLWGVHRHLWTFSYMCFVGKGGGGCPLCCGTKHWPLSQLLFSACELTNAYSCWCVLVSNT